MKQRTKFTILLCLLAPLLVCFTAEVGARLLFGKEMAKYPPEHAFRGNANMLADQFDPNKCSFLWTVLPHPFFSFIHRSNIPPKCKYLYISPQGIDSLAEFPVKKDASFFSVLVVGGSVAWLFGRPDPKTRDNWLLRALEKYRSPNGKPWRVYAGAAGGWTMPNQTTMAAIYGDRFDAIISLDGFNESAATYPDRLEVPLLPLFLHASGVGPIRRAIELARAWFRFSHWLGNQRVALASVFLQKLALTGQELSLVYLTSVQRDFVGTQYRDFRFPPGISKEEGDKLNREKYVDYLKALNGIATARKQHVAHFFQPSLVRFKPRMSDSERKFRLTHHMEALEGMAGAFAGFVRQGYPAADLSRLFEDRSDTIYADSVHFVMEGEGAGVGYAVMAGAIAAHLGRFWKLRKN